MFGRHGVLDLGRGLDLFGELGKRSLAGKDAEGEGEEARGDSHKAHSVAMRGCKTQARSLEEGVRGEG